MKKLLVTLLAASSMASAWAQGVKSPNPNDFVKSAVETVVKAAKADPAAKDGDLVATTKVVEREFLPYTDFERTTRLAVGAPWNDATPAQRKQLFEQFRDLLVHTYALQLVQIHDQNVRFRYKTADVAANGTDAVVRTTVQGAGDDMQVGYRLAQTPAGWRIYDIDMMGAWLILVYQQQFADQLKKGGIDGLIQYLVEHNARFGK
jgi:ABC-type transporter MlaC component